MGVNNVLYDRPDLDQQISRLAALYVSGTLPNAGASAAYEGRLQIHNAVGTCWAEVINGELPPGGSVRVDNGTHEIVVSWPAYQHSTITLANGDFEQGQGAWRCGAGWSVTNQGDPHSGTWCAQFGAGVYGNSSLSSAPHPVIPNTPTSLSVQIQQGASSKKALAMRCLIVWLDADKRPLTIPNVQDPLHDLWTAGNTVDSGSNAEWHVSAVNAIVPSEAKYATADVSAHRARQNKPAWADDVVWTFEGDAVGTDQTTPICITVRVHDAAGRVADWSGCVLVNPVPADLTWRYKLIPYANPFPAGVPAEATVDYDDSTWLESAAPYGNLSTNAIAGAHAHAHDPRLPATVGTTIPKDTGVWIRRHIHLDSVPDGGLNVVAYIDNYLRIYANGAVAFSVNNKYDGPGDGNIPASALQVGDNLIAAWCMDDAGPGGDNDASYFGFLLDLA